MRKELRQKFIDKYWELMELLFSKMLPSNPKDKKVWSRMLRNGRAKNAVPALEAYLKRIPDEKFEAVMAQLDSMGPFELMRSGFKAGLSQLPKRRGGRPGMFSLDIRLRAIQDIGIEYSRRPRLADAIETVAARYGMPTKYLRKVWKDRQRLKQRGD